VCELKNVPVSIIEQTIHETMEIVMMSEFADKLVETLSGGMKRKLSLAMAIVTKPNVLILDEPTSGLDVESRRQVWELIKKIKIGRSVIMSSQHLEEADELADRICIMKKGKIYSLDSPDNIKKEFGVGYKLIIEPKISRITVNEFR
jgi:ABC-type multidrug transport system ATPase subunit